MSDIENDLEDDSTGYILDRLIKKVGEANQKWWLDIHTKEPLKRNIGELLMLVVSECSEALEGDRKNKMDDKLPHRKMFDVEMVDVMIRVFDIAAHLIPEFSAIFIEKMEFNAQREDHKHEHRLGADGKKY